MASQHNTTLPCASLAQTIALSDGHERILGGVVSHLLQRSFVLKHSDRVGGGGYGKRVDRTVGGQYGIFINDIALDAVHALLER